MVDFKYEDLFASEDVDLDYLLLKIKEKEKEKNIKQD